MPPTRTGSTVRFQWKFKKIVFYIFETVVPSQTTVLQGGKRDHGIKLLLAPAEKVLRELPGFNGLELRVIGRDGDVVDRRYERGAGLQ